jgi:hypothetical protein
VITTIKAFFIPVLCVVFLSWMITDLVRTPDCTWDMVWTPALTKEDVRLCAPAEYPRDCYRTLGYKEQNTCPKEGVATP